MVRSVDWSIAVERDGFAIVDDVLNDGSVCELVELVERRLATKVDRGGVRNLLDIAEMRAVADSAALRGLVEPVLGTTAQVVRGILFDKTETANWKVPWHQDVTVAVRERVDAEGYGPWSVKEGVLHVQPPAAVLERMLSVRLHLDYCPEANGALRVIRGSHACGRLADAQVRGWVEREAAVVCETRKGGVLLMRPLLLHASSAASLPGHRRVLHFDYAIGDLARGIEWAASSP